MTEKICTITLREGPQMLLCGDQRGTFPDALVSEISENKLEYLLWEAKLSEVYDFVSSEIKRIKELQKYGENNQKI